MSFFIGFCASMELKANKDMLYLRIDPASACPGSAGVFGHRSSDQINKDSKATGIIADNHIL
ncbi:hypothetical protein SAMN06265367_104339 [Algoriphagus winogradskyi]|uniref:Uncharacterized protein n=1 Tax=Algoriphagus winogradskyi TaxID=237017 RepID=A0ABY1P7W9_9BACT|nr:hypothetical protein SAMN06265367_104339 [Algoriphagus winogradskyi]